jgi:hypothetical protein
VTMDTTSAVIAIVVSAALVNHLIQTVRRELAGNAERALAELEDRQAWRPTPVAWKPYGWYEELTTTIGGDDARLN